MATAKKVKKDPDIILEKMPMIHPNLILRAVTMKGELWLEHMLGDKHWDYIDQKPYFDRETALEMTYVAKSDDLIVE